MSARYELGPTQARRLFAGTSASHPVNVMHGFAPKFLSRGGIRF